MLPLSLLLKVMSFLKSIGGAVYKWYAGETPVHRRDAWIVLLVLLLPGAYWVGKHRGHPAPVPDGPHQTAPVTVAGRAVTVIQYRDKIVYVPQGGGPTQVIDLWPEDKVVTDTNGLQRVDRFGFCLKPGIGYGTDLYGFGPAASVRFVHWKRWGLSGGVVGTKETVSFGPGIDTRFRWIINCRFGLYWAVKGRSIFNADTVDLR